MSSLSLPKSDSAALPRLSITNNINKQEEKIASNKSSATSSRPSSIVKGSNLDPIRLKDSALLVKNVMLPAHPNTLNSIDPVNVAGLDNTVTVGRKLTLPDIVRGSQDEIRMDFNTDTKNTQEDLVVGNIHEVSPCLYNLPTFLDILQKKGCSNREYLNSMEKSRKTVLNDSPGPCYGDINYAIGRHVANDYRFSLLKSNKAKQRDLVNENSKKKIQETFGVKDIFTDKKAIRRLQHFSLYF